MSSVSSNRKNPWVYDLYEVFGNRCLSLALNSACNYKMGRKEFSSKDAKELFTLLEKKTKDLEEFQWVLNIIKSIGILFHKAIEKSIGGHDFIVTKSSIEIDLKIPKITLNEKGKNQILVGSIAHDSNKGIGTFSQGEITEELYPAVPKFAAAEERVFLLEGKDAHSRWQKVGEKDFLRRVFEKFKARYKDICVFLSITEGNISTLIEPLELEKRGDYKDDIKERTCRLTEESVVFRSFGDRMLPALGQSQEKRIFFEVQVTYPIKSQEKDRYTTKISLGNKEKEETHYLPTTPEIFYDPLASWEGESSRDVTRKDIERMDLYVGKKQVGEGDEFLKGLDLGAFSEREDLKEQAACFFFNQRFSVLLNRVLADFLKGLNFDKYSPFTDSYESKVWMDVEGNRATGKIRGSFNGKISNVQSKEGKTFSLEKKVVFKCSGVIDFPREQCTFNVFLGEKPKRHKNTEEISYERCFEEEVYFDFRAYYRKMVAKK